MAKDAEHLSHAHSPSSVRCLCQSFAHSKTEYCFLSVRFESSLYIVGTGPLQIGD